MKTLDFNALKPHKNVFVLGMFCIVFSILRVMGVFSGMDAFIYEQAQQASSYKSLLLFWYAVSWTAKDYIVMLIIAFTVGLGVLVTFWKRREIKTIFVLGFVSILTFSVNWGLKYSFMIKRPLSLLPDLEIPDTPSFPSGHAFGAVLLWFFIPRAMKMLAPHCGCRLQRAWDFLNTQFGTTVSYFFIVLISASRVFLGVHWFSDVMGGMLWGIALSQFVLIFYRQALGNSSKYLEDTKGMKNV